MKSEPKRPELDPISQLAAVTGPVLQDSPSTLRHQQSEPMTQRELTVPEFGVYLEITIKKTHLYMALHDDNSQQDAQECPVCYEGLSGSERTLSCGHVFCHDCLVKTLVSIKVGNIRDTIACPICRHLTFIKKQKEALVSVAANKNPDRQTLEVPVPLTPGQSEQSARSASRNSFQSGVNWFIHRCRSVFQRIRPVRLIRPSQNACQIFIISAQGRPMAEEDALDDVMTDHPQPRRRRLCTTARYLCCLLSAFTLLALVAATLPWVLLA